MIIKNNAFKFDVKKIICFFTIFAFLLFPILDEYKGIGDALSFGEVFLIFCSLIFIIFKQRITINFLNKSIILLILLFSLLTCLDFVINENLILNDSIFLLIRMFMYMIFIIIMSKSIDIDKTIRIYEFICLFLCIFLFFQYVTYYLFDNITSSYLPFFEIKSSLINYANRDMSYVYSIGFRPSSLFSEPAKLVQFLTPYLILLLFNGKRFKNYFIKILFVTLSFVLSTSFMGFLILVSVYFLYFFNAIKNGISKKKFVVLIGLITLICLLFFCSEIIEENVARMINGITKSASISSAGLRLLRGWEIYYKLPFLNKIIGVGFGQVANFLLGNNISIYFGGGYSYGEYMNTISYVLNCSGIVGAIGYLTYLRILYSNSCLWVRQLIIIIFIIGFGGSFLVTPTWVFFMIFIFACAYDKKNIRELQRGKKIEY